MNLLNILSFLTLITCHLIDALPDTNIQIQHYDGPIFMATPNPDCCPFCNSLLKPQTTDNVNPSQAAIIYPQTITFGVTTDEPAETTVFGDQKDDTCEKPTQSKTYQVTVNTSEIPVPDEKITGNIGSMLHTDAKRRSIHTIPVTCRNTGTYGNTCTGTCNTNTYAYNYDVYGTGNPSTADWNLSSYLPINTASQNTCYQVPIVKQDDPMLVPQNFMYSLILDGDVTRNQNGCDCKRYY